MDEFFVEIENETHTICQRKSFHILLWDQTLAVCLCERKSTILASLGRVDYDIAAYFLGRPYVVK